MAVINQKGGVGKTTTTVNLGAAFARMGQNVLICDLDPQCNLTVHVDVDPAQVSPSLYELFHGKAALSEVARPTSEERLDVAPGSIDMAGVELELVNAVGREVILRYALDDDERRRPGRYDIVLLDCPPSLNLLALNALVAVDEIFVPIQAEFFALQGLGKLVEVMDLVRRRLNPQLTISAMVSCRHDPTTNLNRAVIADIGKHFGDVLTDTAIRRNIKLAEAPSYGKTIFEYDMESRGAKDYLALAKELLDRKTVAPAGREHPAGSVPLEGKPPPPESRPEGASAPSFGA